MKKRPHTVLGFSFQVHQVPSITQNMYSYYLLWTSSDSIDSCQLQGADTLMKMDYLFSSPGQSETLQHFSLGCFLNKVSITAKHCYLPSSLKCTNSGMFLSWHCRTEGYSFPFRKKQNSNTYFGKIYLKLSVLSVISDIPGATCRLLDTALKKHRKEC